MAFMRASASAHIFLLTFTSSRCLIAASTRASEIFTSATPATRMAVGRTPGVTLAPVAGREGGIGARRAEAAVTRGVTLATTIAGRDGGTGASRAEAASRDLGVGWPRKVLASAEKVGAFTPGA